MEQWGIWITAAEAAKILGVTRASVYRMVQRGVIPKERKYQKRGLDRDVVERVALDRWRPWSSVLGYRVEAAEILGVTRARACGSHGNGAAYLRCGTPAADTTGGTSSR